MIYYKIIKTILVYIFITNILFAQIDESYKDYSETKIFARDKHSLIMSNYLNERGIPCRKEFLSNHGLLPKNKKTVLTPYFSFSVSKKFVEKSEGKPSLSKDAELLNLDFYIERIESFESENKKEIIWDGRVYSENNELIVGGYSSKYNEQPVGIIDESGRIVYKLVGDKSKEFPILQIPKEEILFDPFTWTLTRVYSSKGMMVQTSDKEYLPIDLKTQHGISLTELGFTIKKIEHSSELKLFAEYQGEKLEIAKCNLKNYSEVKSKEAFRPQLIEGCTQLGDDDVITLNFKGEFSKRISIVDDLVVLKGLNEVKENSYIFEDISIDGDFRDWRNIKGISDFEGDYVSYLYANPDSDLLEIKVTNDDKYLYLYSRVAGAHGRTGENGRYYWYAYIDVDANPYTGYPPTRDDNCYFGIAIGDDSEAQFEFINNRFVKTFFGFTGIGAEEEVLSGKLELGPSYYSSTDKSGNKRDKYKIEYVNREGSRFITHDYTEGTSEDIIIALSPDGSEVEMKVELDGFLQDISGKKLLEKGSKIDIAIGAECSSNHYGADEWGADSSPVIYGYVIR